MPPKTQKCAQNLHLMTPSSANIGQSGLLSTIQIGIHQRSNYHYRTLGCGQNCGFVPPKVNTRTDAHTHGRTDGRRTARHYIGSLKVSQKSIDVHKHQDRFFDCTRFEMSPSVNFREPSPGRKKSAILRTNMAPRQPSWI